ncbi:MAG: OadG family protein [Spirochaetes bacterium]|nr:OadG family protein [Spirochaetota bacterium]
MSNITLGLNFIVTGMAVVFITLAVMSGAMWAVGKMLGGKKKRPAVGKSGAHSGGLSEAEIAAVAAAVHQYRAAERHGTEKRGTVPVFEPIDRWKVSTRIESVERNA